jgi:RNA polymerase sigma-70 factor (ECF subfamily)
MITTQFINDCISGNEEAILSLVRTHQRGVFQVALSVLDTSSAAPLEAAEQAEIATRETFVAALDRLPRYREDIPFTTWLYGVAIDVSRRRFRAWQRQRFLGRLLGGFRRPAREADGAAFNAGPAAGAGSDPAAGPTGPDPALWQAVRALDERLRLPVILRYYHDFPVAEIARLLHMSEGTVHARLDAAREKIAEHAPV